MYRALVLFPASVERTEIDRVVAEKLAPVLSRAQGFLALTMSEGPLMGPAARSGEVGSIMCADFESLGAALAAIQSDDFREGKEESEAMGSLIYLYEVRDIV